MPLFTNSSSSSKVTNNLSISSLSSGFNLVTTVNLSKTFLLLQVSLNVNALIRIRLYTGINYQANDLSRAIDVTPTGDHGVIFDGLFNSSITTINLAPIASGSRLDILSSQIPCTVDNLSATTISNLIANFTYLPLEL